jgi:hypothetical protein
MKLNAKAVSMSAIGVIWIVVVMTILTEISPFFKSILVGIAGHHWVAKGLISAVLFVVFYFFFRKTDESKDLFKVVSYTVGSVIMSGIIIFLLFLWMTIK